VAARRAGTRRRAARRDAACGDQKRLAAQHAKATRATAAQALHRGCRCFWRDAGSSMSSVAQRKRTADSAVAAGDVSWLRCGLQVVCPGPVTLRPPLLCVGRLQVPCQAFSLSRLVLKSWVCHAAPSACARLHAHVFLLQHPPRGDQAWLVVTPSSQQLTPCPSLAHLAAPPVRGCAAKRAYDRAVAAVVFVIVTLAHRALPLCLPLRQLPSYTGMSPQEAANAVTASDSQRIPGGL
jgi:hypothetical protein